MFLDFVILETYNFFQIYLQNSILQLIIHNLQLTIPTISVKKPKP